MVNKEKEKQICGELLRIGDDIDVTAIVTYPKGDILAVESRIPIKSETPQEHFMLLTIIIRGAMEKLEERYGKINFLWFSFLKGQAILFPLKNIIIVVGLKPDASQETITKLFENVAKLRQSIGFETV